MCSLLNTFNRGDDTCSARILCGLDMNRLDFSGHMWSLMLSSTVKLYTYTTDTIYIYTHTYISNYMDFQSTELGGRYSDSVTHRCPPVAYRTSCRLCLCPDGDSPNTGRLVEAASCVETHLKSLGLMIALGI